MESISIKVPGDLAKDLTGRGFDEVESFRGAGEWLSGTHLVLTIAETSLGVGANLVTILVAKEAIGDFARKVCGWVTRRTEAETGSELKLQFTVRRAGEEAEFSLTARNAGASGVPIDTAALESMLTALFSGEGLHGALRPPPKSH